MKRLERGTYIGGHEVSAIAGMNPYMTVADVYANIVHRDAPDISEAPAIRRGRIIEPGFITWLEETRGLSLVRDVFVQDKELPFMGGTMDAIQHEEEGKIMHEVTSTTSRTMDLWSEDEPAKYKWIQTQYYMGLDRDIVHAWIHVLVTDTGEIRSYKVLRVDSAIEALRDEVEDFWMTHILGRVPPVVDTATLPGDMADDMVGRLYPSGNNDEAFEADADLVAMAYDYKEAHKAFKEAEDYKKRLAAALKQSLGSVGKATFENGYVSWKNTRDRSSVNWEGLARYLMKTHLTDDEATQVIANATVTTPGARTLRVQINKEKKA